MRQRGRDAVLSAAAAGPPMQPAAMLISWAPTGARVAKEYCHFANRCSHVCCIVGTVRAHVGDDGSRCDWTWHGNNHSANAGPRPDGGDLAVDRYPASTARPCRNLRRNLVRSEHVY